MQKAKYFGWEFKSALTTAIYKIAADLGLDRVYVTFKDEIPTAAINRHGQIYITNIADDAVLTRFDLERFVGFAFHELLHRKFTNFSAIDSSKVHYLVHLHNGLEDAYIENRAIAEKLTGNAEPLLRNLIDNMAREGLAEVTDWAHPAQYPFALAVYARKHATVKVPLAKGLQPIFDEACLRLNGCRSTENTWELAEWVFDQLRQLGQPQQPEQAKQDAKQDQSGADQSNQDAPSNASDGPTSPDQGQGEGDTPTEDKNASDVGEARSPVKAERMTPKGKVSTIYKPRSTEPKADVPEGARQAGSVSNWAMAKDGHHIGATKRWTINF